jgi:lipoyl-dependent peroxiredoxin
MKELYTAAVQVTGGRDGRAISSDGHLDIPLALPKAIGGSGEGANPELLFAAGFAACFASSIKFVAHQKNLDAGEVTVGADVILGLTESGTYGLKAALDVAVPGLSGANLETVIAEAKRICAYTNATRGQVETTYKINHH